MKLNSFQTLLNMTAIAKTKILHIKRKNKSDFFKSPLLPSSPLPKQDFRREFS